MRMIGALSNPDALAPLLRLDGIRAKLLSGAAKAPLPVAVLKPRCGVVQTAILRVFGASSDALLVSEIHARVERELGYGVVRDTVTSCLSVACRAERSSVVRVSRGCYAIGR